jgi:hypothetical protein
MPTFSQNLLAVLRNAGQGEHEQLCFVTAGKGMVLSRVSIVLEGGCRLMACTLVNDTHRCQPDTVQRQASVRWNAAKG